MKYLYLKSDDEGAILSAGLSVDLYVMAENNDDAMRELEKGRYMTGDRVAALVQMMLDLADVASGQP